MKKNWIIIFIACFYVTGLAQNNEKKAIEVINQSRQQLFKNTSPGERIFIEASSRYSVRKEKLKPGIIPSYDYRTKLWIQSPNQIKLKTLTNYPEGSSQLTEKTASEQNIQSSIKLKGPRDTNFSTFFWQEPGDPKRNEQLLLQKTKYEAFCLSFPILLSFNEGINFQYAGVAKAEDQSADILVTSIENNYRIKLYFDQKTHQLLLMSIKFTEPKTNEDIEQKYFFSDYKEVNGLNFAHKVIIHENGEIVEERDIKTIEINPKLDSNFFEIKK